MDTTSPSSLDPKRLLEQAEQGTSLWKDAWLRLRKNKMAVFAVIVLTLIALTSILGPHFLSFSYEETNLEIGATAPSGDHWLGTDKLGRDQLSRIVYGGRVSLMVGLVATAVSLTIGVLWGTISGFVGGKLDALMMRIVDIMYALPFTIFVILLMVIARDAGVAIEVWLLETIGWETDIANKWNLILLFGAIGAVEWLTMARIVRGQVLSLRRMEFIEACTSLGLSRRRIILRHLIPNVLGPIVVYTTLTIPAVMLLEAFLSFLGLGIQPPRSSWGLLIKEGSEMMEEAPWLLLYPGLLFSLTLFSLNFLGDGLRDALDPKTSKD